MYVCLVGITGLLQSIGVQDLGHDVAGESPEHVDPLLVGRVWTIFLSCFHAISPNEKLSERERDIQTLLRMLFFQTKINMLDDSMTALDDLITDLNMSLVDFTHSLFKMSNEVVLIFDIHLSYPLVAMMLFLYRVFIKYCVLSLYCFLFFLNSASSAAALSIIK